MHATSLGRSNWTGFMSWAARANFCRGVRFSVGPASITSSSMTGIGGWGRDFPRLLLLLLLLVEEASSSFSFGGCFQTKKVLTLVQIKSRNIKIKSIHITCIFLLSNYLPLVLEGLFYICDTAILLEGLHPLLREDHCLKRI